MKNLTKKEFAEFQSWYSGEDVSHYVNGFNPCPYIKTLDEFIKYLSAFEEYRNQVKQKEEAKEQSEELRCMMKSTNGNCDCGIDNCFEGGW